MQSSVQKTNVLITDVGSYLGSQLAKSLLGGNCQVFGVGNSSLLADLLTNEDFTLLELDLTQPLPAHLPGFELVFHLSSVQTDFHQELSTIPNLTSVTSNIISLAKSGKSKVFLGAGINTDEQIYEYLVRDPSIQKFLKLLLIGDVYGPGMFLSSSPAQSTSTFSKKTGTILPALISQVVKGDKIILNNEGLDLVYPAYITDVIFAINKLVFSENSKNIQILVSESPKSSLTVAYEIQKVARVILGKELGLFFAGSEPTNKLESESEVKIHDLGFSPKVELPEGLKNTLEYFSRSQTVIHPGTNQILPKPLVSLADQVDIQTARQQSKRSFLSKFPKTSLKLHLRSSLLIVFAILLLVIGKTIFDVYWGISNLKSSKSALASGDLIGAKEKAKSANNSFKTAVNKTRILLFPPSLIFKKINGVNYALEGASYGSYSTIYFIEGSQQLLNNLVIIAAKDSKKNGLDLETPAANFKKAYFESSLAIELLNKAIERNFLKSKILSAKEIFVSLNQLSESATELSYLVNDFTGKGGSKTYLMLLQNNTELRPGGGFIGNFGTVEFEDGRLKNITIEDIYTIDGQLAEKIEPPKELGEKLGIDRLYLRDSNWSADFAVNAATARDFYKKETGKDVDGVIAVDLSLISDLLSKIGPVRLEDYKEDIGADNLFERGEYYSEVGFFPGSTQKKDFFGSLTRSLVTKVLDSLTQSNQNQSDSPSGQLVALLDVIKSGLTQKHLMLTFDNPNLTSFVKTKGWDQPLPPANFNPADDASETRDFLAISEANLGANKVNRLLQRKISYQLTVGRDADLVAKLKITYTNDSQAETWPAGKYVNFLRVYVPFASDLFEFENNGNKDVSQIEVTTKGNLTTFATFIEVPIKSTREVVFTYRIPKNIKLEKSPFYHLYVQKQPGTEKDQFEFNFNLPGYLVVKSVDDNIQSTGSQNLTIQSDLSIDRQFEVEVVKK